MKTIASLLLVFCALCSVNIVSAHHPVPCNDESLDEAREAADNNDDHHHHHHG